MTKYFSLFFILMTTSITSMASNTLKEQCLAANGVYLETVSITGINNTVHSDSTIMYNVSVKVRDATWWYTVDAKTKAHVAQLAEIAMLTNTQVNTCEDFNGKILYGIELKPS